MTQSICSTLVLSAALILGCGTAYAASVTVTFDPVGPTGDAEQSGTVTTQGFNFTSASFHTVCEGGCVANGTEYLASLANFDSPVVVTSVSGQPFSLSGLDAAKLFLTPGGVFGSPNADTLNLSGTLTGGGTVSTLLTLPAEGAFSKFAVTGFTNLNSLTISGSTAGMDGSWAVDNLVFSTASAAAPEPGPATFIPLALGLLLGWARLKRRA